MTKYLVLYRAEQSATEQMAQSTQEQRDAGMQAWMAWAAKAGDAVVDLGSPLGAAAGSSVAGAPLGGFSILQAESADAVWAVLEGHPHTAMGGTVEVHEFLPMAGG